MTGNASRWRFIGPWLVAAYAAWLLLGVFPISPVEGDEQGVINGATAMARGEVAYLDLAYLPVIQLGAYAILATGNRWTGLSVETLFALTTVGGAALLAGIAARVLAQVLRIPFWAALGALLWSQEISAASFYLNTTAMGMWLAFLALWLACRPPTWRTCAGMVVCLAFAGWIRIDCLLVAPAIPVLLFGMQRDARAAIGATAVVAAGALALAWGLYAASGLTWTDLASTYSGRGAIEGWWPTLRSLPLLLSPVLCVLIAAGLAMLLWRREWWLLALVVAGCAATLPIYGTSLASTKYFYHLVPFLLVPAIRTLEMILTKLATTDRPWRLAGSIALVLVAAGDQLLALQTSTPEFRRYVPEPVVARLATLHGRSRPMTLVVGAGEPIPTADGFRLRGGAFFAPLLWHREKIAMLAQLAEFSARLHRTPAATVYYSGWLPYQMIVRMLRAEGYEFKGRTLVANTMPYTGDWSAANRAVRIDYLAYRGSEYFDPTRHPANPTGENTFFIGDLSGEQPITELADGGNWQPLWPEHRWRFVTFHQRHIPAQKS
jgi:hypothetical protein